MTKKNKLMEVLGKLSLEIYDHIGGLNFKEESFHVAIGHELTLKNIEYLRETSIELYYKKIPIRLGEIDFYLTNEKPPTIIEVKIHSSIVNTHRQQLKMYLLSIKRNPKSILKKVENGILINFLKENPTTHEEEESTRVKDLYKVEMEMFTLGKNDELKLLGKESLGLIFK
jgi:GxxExxY protein